MKLSDAMAGQVKNLAVVEFPDLNGYQSTLGQFIAEELITQLSTGGKPRQFDIVERRQLVRVLREQELTDSSLFDAETIARLGKILGIDALVTGSIADLGTEVKINARAVSVETAKVFAAASTKVSKSETVKQLMRQSAGPSPAGIAPGSPVSQAPGRQVQRGDISFQNDFLRIEISSIAVSKDKKRVSLSLVLQNISTQDIHLAMNWSGECHARVMDNLGTVVPVGYSGDVFVTGLTCVEDARLTLQARKLDSSSFNRFSPGAKTPLVVAFTTDDGEFGGNLFSFSAELLKLEEESFSRFSVGLTDIELQR